VTRIAHRFRLALLAASLGVTPFTIQAAQAEALRPDVAKPLNDAQTLYRAHRYTEALAKISQAAAVPNRTDYETVTIEEMRGATAAAAGENPTAERAYETLLAGGQIKGEDAQRTAAALAGLYFQQKDYGKAISAAQRYQKLGGADPQMQTLLIEAHYLSGDNAGALALLKSSVDAQTRAGHTPDEAQLQLLGTVAQRANDPAAYRGALEKLVAFHSKPEYWTDLIHAIRSKPGYLSALDVDVYRLRRAAGTLASADDYMEMTQLAIVAGSTAEGKQVVDQGFASGALGHDAQDDRERRLQALAAKRASSPADPKNPVAPFDAGFNQVFAGQPQAGFAAMDAALAKGVDHPDLARLRLGEAYYFAGQKGRAIAAFKTVKGSDGAADLAQLWLLITAKS
jgi:hypothetical protein